MVVFFKLNGSRIDRTRVYSIDFKNRNIVEYETVSKLMFSGYFL